MAEKIITFDTNADIANNFTSIKGSGSSQTTTDGKMVFSNSINDQDNTITTNFLTGQFINSAEVVYSLTTSDSASSYTYPIVFRFQILNSTKTSVNTLTIQVSFQYDYTDPTWQGYNYGYIYYYFTGEGYGNNTLAYSRRLATAPPRSNYNSYKVVDNKNGTATFYLNGSASGTTINLGNSGYRLGESIYSYPIYGWWNKYAVARFETYTFDYDSGGNTNNFFF